MHTELNQAEYSNALANETSPYLLQHANNPVEWFPWGKEALDKARQENKPILLSIGYSACHWCHVMAHESFEDDKTAQLMNDRFINIKVDREERPDLDKIYQRAHQLLSQRPGGWPLTVFLMPDDHMPFFAGTYFPKEPRHQLPSFKDLLQKISDFYANQIDDLRKQNTSLRDAMASLKSDGFSDKTRLTPAVLDIAHQQLGKSTDWQHGGFGQAPKFPHPGNIERLLRHWSGSNKADEKALKAATFTLRKMAQGGVNDQLDGGFCRYSVDDYWMIPHFEKMLYDNGPLLALYSQAWAATGEPLFNQVAETTAEWTMREMQAPEGGYYSSLDADSEGEEGKFYAWTCDEVSQVLDKQEYDLFSQRYGLDRDPNFEGKWYPHVFSELETLAQQQGISESEAENILQQARKKLFVAREKRIRPGRDDKVLTSWNALMIKGMAIAARHQDNDALRKRYIDSATRALDFIRRQLWEDGRLLATCKDGKAHLNAYLDDYAFLMDAILELLQVQWRSEYLAFADELASSVLENFEDHESGGFFFTAHNHEPLIERPKPFGDDAIPAGNGIVAYILSRLGHLLDKPQYLEAAERTLKAAWSSIEQLPYAHCTLLLALEEYLYPPQIIILRGKPGPLHLWKQRCISTYAPRRLCLAIPNDESSLPEGLEAKKPDNQHEVVAYVCSGTTCQPPVTSLDDLESQLVAE